MRSLYIIFFKLVFADNPPVRYSSLVAFTTTIMHSIRQIHQNVTVHNFTMLSIFSSTVSPTNFPLHAIPRKNPQACRSFRFRRPKRHRRQVGLREGEENRLVRSVCSQVAPELAMPQGLSKASKVDQHDHQYETRRCTIFGRLGRDNS